MPAEFQLYGYYAHGNMATKDSSNMPFITWPNRAPCLIANLYMLSLLDRKGRSGRNGLSRRGAKGGTMGLYASHLSILIRLVWKYSKSGRRSDADFYHMNDDLFTKLIHEIRTEPAPYNPEQRKRNENTVNTIGRTWLDFLYFVGVFHGDENFVSATGSIRGHRKDMEIKTKKKGGRSSYTTYWHHHSLSGGERLKTRNPIPDADIEKLKRAASKIKDEACEKNPTSAKSAKFIYQRRLCFIAALENTGARRGELALLRVDDVERASRESSPMLRLCTLKREQDAERFVPVTLNFLQAIKKYIKVYRRPIIKNTIGLKNDHGFVFVSAKTGKPLSETTLSNEIGTLRKAAGISAQACAHMFRHRFITKLFVTLIEQHQLTNKDQFRQNLLDSEHWKLLIQQWTDHKNRDSLDTYIDLAFAMKAKRKKTVEGVYILQAQEAFDEAMKSLLEDLKDGMTITQYEAEVKTLMELRDKDMGIAQARANEESGNQLEKGDGRARQ
ncbi:MAG: tyrosine-type recombinase/integrase [Motiliproteus sp.]